MAVSASLKRKAVKVLVVNAGALPQGFSQPDVAFLPDKIYMSCGTNDFFYSSVEEMDRITRGTRKAFIKRLRKGEGHSVPIDVFWKEWEDVVEYVRKNL